MAPSPPPWAPIAAAPRPARREGPRQSAGTCPSARRRSLPARPPARRRGCGRSSSATPGGNLGRPSTGRPRPTGWGRCTCSASTRRRRLLSRIRGRTRGSLDMVGDAWDRRALRGFPPGRGQQRSTNLYEVHRALDPNENFRPALGIAAILLVLYSIAAGPARRSCARASAGRPLDPLVWAPVASATCFALIVVVGLAGKGWSGRARHLALVEAGRRDVARQREALPRVLREPDARDARARVRARKRARYRDGRLARRRARRAASRQGRRLAREPDEPAVADRGRQRGRLRRSSAAGSRVREKSDGSVVVANHTGHALRNVVVWAPKTDASWFASIDDGRHGPLDERAHALRPGGARHRAHGGHAHGARAGRPARCAASSVTPADDMTPRGRRSTAAAGSSTDWWPDDVPVVIGEIARRRGREVATRACASRATVLLFRIVGRRRCDVTAPAPSPRPPRRRRRRSACATSGTGSASSRCSAT